MNIMFESFPDTVRVERRDYEIVTDFREWIKLSELLENTERLTSRILNMIMDWYLVPPPQNTEMALYALGEFLGAEAIHPFFDDSADQDDDEETKSHPDKLFSYSEDAIYIYSAFRAVYGIDIEEIEYMHWWKFRALFDGLPEDTEIKQRMHYRGVDLNEIRDKEEKKRIKRIKNQIRLHEKKRVMNDFEIGDVFG